MTKPWISAPSNQLDLKSLAGELVFFCVGGCHAAQDTRFGVKPVVRAAVVILTGERAGEEITDALVFNTRPVRRLRGVAGQVVLTRIIVDPSAQNGAVDFDDADETDEALATTWTDAFPDRLDALIKLAEEAFVAEESKDREELAQPQQQRQAQAAKPSAGLKQSFANPRGQANQAPSAPPPWAKDKASPADLPTPPQADAGDDDEPPF